MFFAHYSAYLFGGTVNTFVAVSLPSIQSFIHYRVVGSQHKLVTPRCLGLCTLSLSQHQRCRLDASEIVSESANLRQRILIWEQEIRLIFLQICTHTHTHTKVYGRKSGRLSSFKFAF